MFKEVLPIGTAVVIDLETFGFVYSPNRVAALLQSIEVFGAHSPGFSFDIGRPLYLSGLQSIR